MYNAKLNTIFLTDSMFFDLQPMATATSLPAVQPFTGPGKASIYPSFHNVNHSILTPFPVQTAGYPAVHTMPTYNGGCNGTNSSFAHLQTSSYSSGCNINGTGSSIPHVPTTSTFSPYFSNHIEGGHTMNSLLQPVSLTACILVQYLTRYFLLHLEC